MTCIHGSDLCEHKINEAVNSIRSGLGYYTEPVRIVSPKIFNQVKEVATKLDMDKEEVFKIIEGYEYFGEKIFSYPKARQVIEQWIIITGNRSETR